VRANVPYAAMLLLGAAVLVTGADAGAWGWLAAAAYVAYGVTGAVWIMLFVCPCCAFHGTRLCPCGYGLLSARLRARQPDGNFARQFRRHIPVIVPLWFVPPVVGGVLIAVGFSWALAGLLGAFVLNSFVLLPLTSTRHSCVHCPQKADCPWMSRRAAAAAPAE